MVKMDSVVFLIVILVMMVLLMMDGGSEGAPAKSSLQIDKPICPNCEEWSSSDKKCRCLVRYNTYPCPNCADWCREDNSDEFTCNYSCGHVYEHSLTVGPNEVSHSSHFPLCTKDFKPVDKNAKEMCDVIKHCYTDKDKKYDERANTYYLKLIPGHKCIERMPEDFYEGDPPIVTLYQNKMRTKGVWACNPVAKCKRLYEWFQLTCVYLQAPPSPLIKIQDFAGRLVNKYEFAPCPDCAEWCKNDKKFTCDYSCSPADPRSKTLGYPVCTEDFRKIGVIDQSFCDTLKSEHEQQLSHCKDRKDCAYYKMIEMSSTPQHFKKHRLEGGGRPLHDIEFEKTLLDWIKDQRAKRSYCRSYCLEILLHNHSKHAVLQMIQKARKIILSLVLKKVMEWSIWV
uniref:Uncharacterized protein n=1 Tax=Meloidogyne incognita TaxID=6306 RepID=A0A914L4E1_MELIC